MNNKQNIEVRNITGNVAASEGRVISGYAVRFNELSQYMGFYEVIDPSAITEDVIKKSDIFMRFDHKEDNFLARSRYGTGSLKLELREDGLYYEFEVPETAFGEDVLSKIQRGECMGSSFAFCIGEERGAEKWSRNANGELLRRIYNIGQLFDCSVVAEPAYLSTSVQSRSLDAVQSMVSEYDTMHKELIDMELDNELDVLNEYAIE